MTAPAYFTISEDGMKATRNAKLKGVTRFVCSAPSFSDGNGRGSHATTVFFSFGPHAGVHEATFRVEERKRSYIGLGYVCDSDGDYSAPVGGVGILILVFLTEILFF